MIIFEGEELILHYHEGQSDYILITFASADQTEKAHSEYFLKPVVEKYNLSCLGITTKIDNYYQHSDMYQIIPLCNEITQNYKKIIVTGLSMAAYGALKFSAELKADVVFAMGVRYTLDKNIASVSGIMQRTVDRLDLYSIAETTIQPHEVSGKLYIAHDTHQGPFEYNAIDHEHAYKIIKNLPNTVLVPVLYAHHLVINSLKGSVEFKSILDALITEDDKAIIKQVAKVRRHHIHNISFKIFLFRMRYPLLIYKLLISQPFSKVKNNHVLFNNHENNLLLIYILRMRGYFKESRNLLRLCFLRSYLNSSFYEVNQVNKRHIINMNAPLYYLPYLIAYNHYILVLDQVQSKIVAVRGFIYDAHCLPIRLYGHKSCYRLVCTWEDTVLELRYHQGKILLRSLVFDDQPDNIIIVKAQENTVSLYTPDDRYCFQVDQKGKSEFCSTECKEWEQFAVI